MTDRRTVTHTDVVDPPGYFLIRTTGTIHLVRRLQQVAWSDGDHWQAIDFWCSNITTGAKGTFLYVAPPGGATCRACLKRRFRNLPRVRSA